MPSSQAVPPQPLGDLQPVLYVCESVSVLWVDSSVSYFRFHIQVMSYRISLSLSDSLNVIVSSSVHVAANDIS